MNWNRITNHFPTIITCSVIPSNGQFSCIKPSAPPVGFNPANIKMRFFTRPHFGYVGVSAFATTELSVMSTFALLVIPWDSFKRISTMIASMLYVSNQPFPFIRRRLAFVSWRQSEPVLIAYRMASIIISVLRSMPAVALLRAKAGCFYAVVRNAVFCGARGAFKCVHRKTIPNFHQKSRQHLGSGSIAIACHDLGFELTASELDEDYFNAAVDRIQRHQQQQTLDFDG